MEKPSQGTGNLSDNWETCIKIQNAVKDYDIDLKTELSSFDTSANGTITEMAFMCVLAKYQNVMELTDVEIHKITDHFRAPDGHIAFKEFCGAVYNRDNEHFEHIDHSKEINALSDQERRQLILLLQKIAKSSLFSLLPYFQDYELVTNNNGSVTVAHFARILHFMKLYLTEKEFMLLYKCYMTHSFLVRYGTFVYHVDAVRKYLKTHKAINANDTDAISNLGNLIGFNLPTSPPTVKFYDNPNKPDNTMETIKRLQRYIHENRLRTCEFMEPFDQLKLGTITKNQFVRALSVLGISEKNNLKLSGAEMEGLFKRYAAPNNSDRIKWRLFVDDVDKVFTEKLLHRTPRLNVESPPKEIANLPRPGQRNWQNQPQHIRDLCEETVRKIQNKINTRRLHLFPFFRNYDRLHKGYILPNQGFRVLLSNSILVSEEEFEALKARYCNDMGFNYVWLLEEVDPAEFCQNVIDGTTTTTTGDKSSKEKVCSPKDAPAKINIIRVLAKVKKQMTVNGVKLLDFLLDYDHHRTNQIHHSNFRRGLDNANINLSVTDMDIICDLFRSNNRGCHIRYRDFCKAVDEIFIQNVSEDAITTPLKHFPCVDCVECALNFEERTIASKALQKLATKPDQISNIQRLFKDFDRENCGTITQNQFLRALCTRDMNSMISSREFDVICKCFGVERGLQIEFNYRAFLDVVNILHETGQVNRRF